MAAIAQRLIHLRPNFHSYARPHPYTIHHFSSASDPDAQSDIPHPDPNSEAQTRSPHSSSISSVKATLPQQPPSQNRDRYPRVPSMSSAGSNDSISRRLSEFQSRSSAPPPSSSTGNHFSLQELYERNVNSKGDVSANSFGINSGGKRSVDPIHSRLRQLNPGAKNEFGGKLSDNLILRRGKGNGSLPGTTSGRIREHLDLGKNLKMLRPQDRKGKWFSLQELSDRLAKLKEAQQGRKKYIHDFRGAFTELQKDQEQPMMNLGFFGPKGGIESSELLPPKKDLVEKYFHPDNMSSAEKIKLELKKVRDEFKMSESDCGSARVQVAQLTIKIKHLSTVLKKKDKHSRKGLQAMVQRRKKLLKYLRQTDWDSYCLVLSKLGLRDNPDVKA